MNVNVFVLFIITEYKPSISQSPVPVQCTEPVYFRTFMKEAADLTYDEARRKLLKTYGYA